MSAYATIGQLIKAAYANLGIVDLKSDISPEQYEQGLNSLNAMLGGFSRKRLNLQGTFDESFTLINGQATYTIGSGLEFNTTRPIEIISAFIRDSNGTDYPILVTTQGQYDQIAVKTVTGLPERILFNPRTSVATLYPVPDDAYTLQWRAQKLITSFAAIEDVITLPEEYEELLEYNLSIRLAPKSNVDTPQEVAAIASSSLANFTMAVEPAQFDGVFVQPGRYNIYSDNC